jgi:outer membrane receptor for ferrienterochelin and colicins
MDLTIVILALWSHILPPLTTDKSSTTELYFVHYQEQIKKEVLNEVKTARSIASPNLSRPMDITEGEDDTYNLNFSNNNQDKLKNYYINDKTDTNFYQKNEQLDAIVVSGSLRPMSKSNSIVPVDIYNKNYFKANPNPSLFEAIQNVNGLRPQLNCNVCATGDIHINGLEGPYTMILIDGMPIVSGLSTVYGLNGIPQSIIERIEVVKGPSSTLYGSEAIGGIINVVTKSPLTGNNIYLDVFGTDWKEINTDLAASFNLGKKSNALVGFNHFSYNNPIDRNKDNFTDLTLQNRSALFSKFVFKRKQNRIFSLSGRLITENRWGGQMQWNKNYKGSEEIYGESIDTRRWELQGTYQLPAKEPVTIQFSANNHLQNSAYGTTHFDAKQFTSFGLLSWNKSISNHNLLLGLSYRYTYYDDNTPITAAGNNLLQNLPINTHLPGIFLQDELQLAKQHNILLGLRYDYNNIHGNIFSPRIYYKWHSKDKSQIGRIGIGNGFRAANVFTEDHAALTGARTVVFVNKLQPEKSWNLQTNYIKKLYFSNAFLNLDFSGFYTYFNNRIIANLDIDPNKIIYNNLNGYGISRGLALNLELRTDCGLNLMTGATFMDVFQKENGTKTKPLFTETFTAVWNIGYALDKLQLSLDYTGNVYSPMRLPLISDWDPRSPYSPWWSIQNIQVTKTITANSSLFFGLKNILNWTPAKNNPFLIARSHDPFDKEVSFDTNGQALVTPNNPYGLTFDPTYAYAPNQGRRFFLGFKWQLKAD